MEVLLVFFRLLPLFVVSPIIAFNRVPILARVLLVVMLAFVMASGHKLLAIEQPFVWLLISEFLIGATLALSFHIALAALHFIGHLVDLQVGFASGAIFDPSTEVTSTPVAELMTVTVALVVFISNLHLDLIYALSRLYEFVPIGSGFKLSQDWYSTLFGVFVGGFIIVSPVVISLWLVDFGLAFISRSLPQAQIYFVGLPVKIGLGMLLLAWFSQHAIGAVYRLLQSSIEMWELLLLV